MVYFHGVTGAVNRAELLAAGFVDREIRRALDVGTLVSLAPGVVIPRDLLAEDTPEERHRQRALAAIRRDARTPEVRAAKHTRALALSSAAAVLGLPVWGLDTSRVSIADSGRTPGTRTTSRTRLITDTRPPAVVEVDGVLVVSPARTVVDIARTGARVPAIAVGDAALHAGLCTVDDLQNELDLLTGMRGRAAAIRAIGRCDRKCESVLETRSRVELVDAGVPEPELQVNIYDAHGNFLARVDLYWRDARLCGEADGNKKYGDDADETRRALLAEKSRGDGIVETGHALLRWGWRDVDEPAVLARRVLGMLGRRAA